MARALGRTVRPAGSMIAAHPKPTGIVVGFAVLFAFVAANAFYGQAGRHPHPMLVTRAEPAGGAGAQTVASNDPGLQPVPMVREVQAALAQAGYYTIAVDGRPGPATETAIKAFQSDHGLRVDGEPTPVLLSQVRQVASLEMAPSPEPRPTSDGRSGRVLQTAATETGSITPPLPAAPPAASNSSDFEGLPETELVKRIQEGLSAAQVASLDADGIAGSRTRAAIATFEALEGLDVTGKPRPQILERLVEIGAVQ
ncbi:peptidoglycan-binding domain-containing protein [Consotaella aegiceratis]|uniref:peptidoglycan-binding domain-containing protein n=1 Tax=Consotaella aegiceratis TaxID=3097961 RepID=UPI002F41C023